MYKLIIIPCLTLVSILLSGCGATQLSGRYLEPTQLQTLKTQKLTKNEVLQQIGSPTLTPHYSPNIWYYVGRTITHKLWNVPKVQKQEIVQVIFKQDQDIVSDVRVLLNTMNTKVAINSQHTKNVGTEKSFLQLFAYNFNRIHNKKKLKS